MEGETNAIPEFYVSWSRDGDGKKGRNRNQKRKRDFSLFHIAGSIVAGHEGWRNRWRSPARELIDIWPCTTCYPSPAILGLHLRATPPRQTEGAHPSEFRTAAPPAGTFASFHRLCNPRDCVFGGIIIGENLLFSKSFFQQYSFLLLERAHERDNTICPFIQLFIKLNGISFPRIFLTPKHPSLDKMCISSSIEGIVFQIVISFDKTDQGWLLFLPSRSFINEPGRNFCNQPTRHKCVLAVKSLYLEGILLLERGESRTKKIPAARKRLKLRPRFLPSITRSNLAFRQIWIFQTTIECK